MIPSFNVTNNTARRLRLGRCFRLCASVANWEFWDMHIALGLAFGAAFGVATGVVTGILFGQLGFWLGICSAAGAGIGVAIGAILSQVNATTTSSADRE